MTITLDKKTISLITIAIITIIGTFGGNHIYSNGYNINGEIIQKEIIQTVDAKISQHKAESDPHHGTSIKLENIQNNIDSINRFMQTTEEKIDRIMVMMCSNDDFNC